MITAIALPITYNPHTRVGYKPHSSVAGATDLSWSSGAYFDGDAFGEVDIEWPEDVPPTGASAGNGAVLNTPSLGGRITFRAIDAAGTVQLEHEVPFDFLAPWPAAFHLPNGMARTSADALKTCAAARLDGGLTPACAAVLASCDGHRWVDLSKAKNRGHSNAASAFIAAMSLAAVLALVGLPAALAWLLFALVATPSVRANNGSTVWRVPLILTALMALYTMLWWQHIVLPFET
jgi:hypothetical protein